MNSADRKCFAVTAEGVFHKKTLFLTGVDIFSSDAYFIMVNVEMKSLFPEGTA